MMDGGGNAVEMRESLQGSLRLRQAMLRLSGNHDPGLVMSSELALGRGGDYIVSWLGTDSPDRPPAGGHISGGHHDAVG